MQQVEVVLAHHERVTMRVGDLFIKIDTHDGAALRKTGGHG
ncbi:hypothetical protein HNR22_001586 [Micromonospora jinlongensis]|uniref:Uncharacterized protein n=1 Tax=Micromonospora jinlongensis TaxID=1287877 RepID=A0A7Y9WZ75_9ACTN|nr:hypothetical protein [Micromonospora jinlongensis]NYH41859.1 hypothetical protein [Micromonospora jinlongensis]